MIPPTYFERLPVTVSMLVFLAISVSGALWIHLRSQRWMPDPAPPRDRRIGRLEARVLVTLSLQAMLMLLYDSPVVESAARMQAIFMNKYVGTYVWGTVLVLVMVVAAGVCSWRFSTILATLVLGTALILGVKGGEQHLRFISWQWQMVGRPAAAGPFATARVAVAEPALVAEIERLLDRARLDNYQPPLQWYDAFLSYGSHGWTQLQTQSKSEPELRQLADRCANHVYHIDQVQSSGEAWATLMRIADQAVRDRQYADDSCAGRAVELLVPQLDPQQLISKLIQGVRDPECPLAYFSLRPPGEEGPLLRKTAAVSTTMPPGALSMEPVVQAAWNFDRALGPHSVKDNPVEDRVTPAILRRILVRPNLRDYAEALGGPAWDQFLLRHDWRAPPPESGATAQQQRAMQAIQDWMRTAGFQGSYGETVMVGSEPVNLWFHKLATLDSPAGKQFRRQQRDPLLQLAARSLTPVRRPPAKTTTEQLGRQVAGALRAIMPRSDNKWATPPQLEFLFVDREFTSEQPSLAMEFWPYFQRKASVAEFGGQAALQLRWNYLARLWPESTVEMFANAYPEQSPLWQVGDLNKRGHYLGYLLPHSIPPADRFEILSAVRDSLRAKLAALPESQREAARSPYSPLNDIDFISWSLAEIPCPAGAAAFRQRYAEDDSSEKLSQLLQRMAGDVVYHDLVERLAEDEDPELRSASLPAIRHHPIPRRVKLLAALLNDPDDGVRAAATEVQQELTALRTDPLPRRASR